MKGGQSILLLIIFLGILICTEELDIVLQLFDEEISSLWPVFIVLVLNTLFCNFFATGLPIYKLLLLPPEKKLVRCINSL